MNKQTIVVIVLAIIILALLGGLGFFYMQTVKANAMVKILSSKLVSTVVLFGEVQNVSSDRTVTLNYNGNKIAVKVEPSAKILAMVNGAQKEVTLQDIKVGNFVNIPLDIKQDYAIEGSQVLILPNFLPSTAK